MFRKLAVLAAVAGIAMGLAATAVADSSVVLRVVAIKTADVPAYVQEIDKARGMLKRLGLDVRVRVWRATFAGPDTGNVIVSQEYTSMVGFADGMTKAMADPEYVQWLKNLDKVRTVVSDSLYREM